MEVTLLVQVIAGLTVILFILIFLFVVPSNKKKPEPKKVAPVAKNEKPKTDMNSLRTILRNRNTSASKLEETLDLVIKHHGTIHKKLGSRTHPDFDAYMEILLVICRHKNTSKDIILKFDRELARKNPTYKQEINEAVKKGLDSR